MDLRALARGDAEIIKLQEKLVESFMISNKMTLDLEVMTTILQILTLGMS